MVVAVDRGAWSLGAVGYQQVGVYSFARLDIIGDLLPPVPDFLDDLHDFWFRWSRVWRGAEYGNYSFAVQLVAVTHQFVEKTCPVLRR